MDYAVCQIAGRQYLVKPGQTIEVNKLTLPLAKGNLEEEKTLSCDKVLLIVSGDKVEVGTPFLKKNLDFEVLETVKMDKIRVAKFKSKSNYRRVTGSRAQMTRIKLKV